MAFEKNTALACPLALLAVLTQAMLATVCCASTPEEELKRLARKARAETRVYEVSKSGKDQKKLARIFVAVREQVEPTLTKPEFVRRLKAREHFEIRFPEKCQTCKGWGRITPARGKRDKDGKIRCSKCRGSGTEFHRYLIKWSNDVITHKGDRRDPIMAALRRELGDNASALVWFNTAEKFHTGELRHKTNSRAIAHTAYEEAVKLANAAWRDDEPANSEMNRVHRRVIDDGLEGIAETLPKKVKEPEKQKEPDPEPKAPEKRDEPRDRIEELLEKLNSD